MGLATVLCLKPPHLLHNLAFDTSLYLEVRSGLLSRLAGYLVVVLARFQPYMHDYTTYYLFYNCTS